MDVINHDHPQEEIDQLLQIIDPHNIKTMTFSQIVRLLSNQLTNSVAWNTNPPIESNDIYSPNEDLLTPG